MQGAVFFRPFAILAVAMSLAACSNGQRASSGNTPAPRETTMAQANSTSAPDAAKSKLVKSHFSINSAKSTSGITFSVYVDGQPGPSLNTPGTSTDISNMLAVGNNTIVVRWKKDRNTGSGTLTIVENGKPLLKQIVRAADPVTGQKSVSVRAK
ncbi:MAG TPA: hypothetical protein VIG51_06070 [Candidatus Baltobacteraceae bacterium]|jgi:hypothetical protein